MKPLLGWEEIPVRAITVKNIPDELYERLKEAAESHHRSINSELIYTLQNALMPQQIDKEHFLANARRLRESIDMEPVTQEELDRFKNEGRP
jgi:plasmid stability protein